MATHLQLNELGMLRGALSFVVLALLLAWETGKPFFSYFSGKWSERCKHGFKNLVMSAVNSLMIAVSFSIAWAAVSHWSEERGMGILQPIAHSTGWHAAVAIVALDLWTYWWHWFNHRIPFFWRFHRMHHSDSFMDVTTANRFHTGEIFFSSVIRIGLIPLLGIRLWELAIYEMLLFAVVQFHHANIALPGCLEDFLRWIIPTPAMHKVHHSRVPAETNSNYSSLLSIWDRLFKTFASRRDLHEIQFGLAGFDDPRQQTLKGLLRTPFHRK
jgi:sterol desaturase/sphingolipid hydroxylase (fatty acid hydroxylase superfamily)